MSDEIKVERHGHVTVAVLNRPHRKNALTVGLAAMLEEAVCEFGSNPDQRVLIITGAGEEAFSSGADLAEMRERFTTGQAMPVPPEQDIAGVAACEKPVIAAINGLAIGGGFEIALCCDFRIASENAWFSFPEAERGFIAGIAAVTLPRMISIGSVMEMLLTGQRLSAADAFRLGLVQRVVAPGETLALAMQYAERMSSFSPAALRGTKKVVRYWRDHALEQHHQYYQKIIKEVLDTGELLEGLAAFQEKRKPDFRKV